jgi:hypothetical protein
MFTQSTANFIHGSGGEEAEVSVEIIPRDQDQFDMFKVLEVDAASVECSGGRFVITIKLKKPVEAVVGKPNADTSAT